MITFIDLTFSPSGSPVPTVLARLQRIPGVTSVMGDHDVMFHWRTTAEFDAQMLAIHRTLHETGATYRVCTVEDSYQSLDPVPWVGPGMADPPQHPAIPERQSPGLDPPRERGPPRRGAGKKDGTSTKGA